MKGEQPYGSDNLMKRYIKPVTKATNIYKNIGLHTFRTLKANGEDVKTVQELLQDATSRVTLHIYTQAVASNKRAAQSKVGTTIIRDAGQNAGEMDRRKLALERNGSLSDPDLLVTWRCHSF